MARMNRDQIVQSIIAGVISGVTRPIRSGGGGGGWGGGGEKKLPATERMRDAIVNNRKEMAELKAEQDRVSAEGRREMAQDLRQGFKDRAKAKQEREDAEYRVGIEDLQQTSRDAARNASRMSEAAKAAKMLYDHKMWESRQQAPASGMVGEDTDVEGSLLFGAEPGGGGGGGGDWSGYRRSDLELQDARRALNLRDGQDLSADQLMQIYDGLMRTQERLQGRQNVFSDRADRATGLRTERDVRPEIDLSTPEGMDGAKRDEIGEIVRQAVQAREQVQQMPQGPNAIPDDANRASSAIGAVPIATNPNFEGTMPGALAWRTLAESFAVMVPDWAMSILNGTSQPKPVPGTPQETPRMPSSGVTPGGYQWDASRVEQAMDGGTNRMGDMVLDDPSLVNTSRAMGQDPYRGMAPSQNISDILFPDFSQPQYVERPSIQSQSMEELMRSAGISDRSINRRQ